MSFKHLAAVAAGVALAFGLAGAAQAANTPLFSFEQETIGLPPTIGTVVAGVPIVESTDPTSADSFSKASGIDRPGSKQLLLDTSVGEDVFGVGLILSSWTYDLTVTEAETFTFGYNFFTNFAPGQGFDFFQIDLIDTASTTLVNLAFVDTSTSPLVAGGPLLYTTGAQLVSFTPAVGSYSLQFTLGTDQTGCGLASDGSVCIPSFAVINAVPEPGSLALVALALGGVLLPGVRRSVARAATATA